MRLGARQGDAREGERGSALIIVLGLVALISTWAVSAAYDDNLALRRAENSLDFVRAKQASQSALLLSVKALRADARDSQSDDLDELWAQEGGGFPVDQGMVAATIVDANRFINLNGLVDAQGKAVAAVEQQVKALFVRRELDPTLVDALIDWMDADDQRHGSGGAESGAYYGKNYRIKNARLDRWNELLLVRGFNQKILDRLLPVATVAPMPATGIAAVNINTAPADVLMALAPNMQTSDAEALMAARPFENVAQALLNQPWGKGLNTAYLSVQSRLFWVLTEADFGRVSLREQFLLQREQGKITLLTAQRAEWHGLGLTQQAAATNNKPSQQRGGTVR